MTGYLGKQQAFIPAGLCRAAVRRANAGIPALLVVVIALAGCWNGAPELERISYVRWEQIRRSHQGNVLVVNVWASWCRTCIDLLPSIVEQQRAYEPVEVQFVSLCLDDWRDAAGLEIAEQLLGEQRANSPHYLFEEDFTEILDKLDLPGVPAVLVYDARGRLQHKLVGDPLDDEISPADVRDAIESVMPGSGAQSALRSGGCKPARSLCSATLRAKRAMPKEVYI